MGYAVADVTGALWLLGAVWLAEHALAAWVLWLVLRPRGASLPRPSAVPAPAMTPAPVPQEEPVEVVRERLAGAIPNWASLSLSAQDTVVQRVQREAMARLGR